MTGILEHIDGRKLTLGGTGLLKVNVYLRKGVDSSQYLPLLQSEVDVETTEEKGFYMVEAIKPSLPKTAVEEIKGPVDMPPSKNVPVLNFQAAQASFVQAPAGVVPKFDAKQKLITASWAMGAVLNSKALSEANDAMALSTSQLVERAKKLARELINWAEEQAAR